MHIFGPKDTLWHLDRQDQSRNAEWTCVEERKKRPPT